MSSVVMVARRRTTEHQIVWMLHQQTAGDGGRLRNCSFNGDLIIHQALAEAGGFPPAYGWVRGREAGLG